MKVLVTGGRHFDDKVFLEHVLDQVSREIDITTLIHGNAKGADKLSGKWAKKNNIPVIAEDADWDQFGHAAGPIRNKVMLEMNPDLVVAFVGWTGTENMKEIAREAGVDVYEAHRVHYVPFDVRECASLFFI